MALQIASLYFDAHYRARWRETADWIVVVRGDAWTNAPANVNWTWASKDGTAQGKEFTVLGPGVTVGATYYTLNYKHSISNPVSTQMQPSPFSNQYAVNNYAIHFNLYIESTPAYDVQLFSQSGGDQLWLTTANKLKVINGANNQTSATALSNTTNYQVELRRTKSGALDVRHDEGAVEATVTSDASALNTDNFNFGGNTTKNQDPNCGIRLSEIVIWAGNDAISTSWMNTCTCVYATVGGVGTYNDATYVGSSTLWQNVDDYTANDGDTTYNEIGFTEAAEAQTYIVATGTYAATIKGVCYFSLSKIENSAYWTYSESGIRVRDNSVNYDGMGSTQSSDYVSTAYGFDHRPGGGAWTQAVINATEIGGWRTKIPLGESGLESHNYPTGDGADSDWTGVPNGSPNKYTNIDETGGVGWSDYCETTTLNARQAFTKATLAYAEDKNIVYVWFYSSCQGEAGYKFKFYIKIGGTRYYTSEITPATAWSGQSYGLTVSPATGIAFRKAELEAAEIGWECTAVPAAGGDAAFMSYRAATGVGI